MQRVGTTRAAERGGMSILVMGVLVGAAFLMLILAAVGGGYVAHAELQQSVDVAAASVEAGGDAPASRARKLAKANGAARVDVDVVDGGARLRIRAWRRGPKVAGTGNGIELHAEAFATIPVAPSGDFGPNPPGQYNGPIVYVDGVPICPVVGAAYQRMDAAASRDGVSISATSGFRTYAEQAVLYAQLGPGIAAPPGVSRHHDATEFDLSVGPAGSSVHRWLQRHGPSFGFIQRYSWEPWTFWW